MRKIGYNACTAVYLIEKLAFTLIIKKFPAFYWNRRFVTVTTTVRHLSYSERDQYCPRPPSYIFKISFNIILLSMSRSSKWSLSSKSLHRNQLWILLHNLEKLSDLYYYKTRISKFRPHRLFLVLSTLKNGANWKFKRNRAEQNTSYYAVNSFKTKKNGQTYRAHSKNEMPADGILKPPPPLTPTTFKTTNNQNAANYAIFQAFSAVQSTFSKLSVALQRTSVCYKHR